MSLTDLTGGNLTVVELFAVFHDSCRYSEGSDPRHGPSGAELDAQYLTTHLQSLADDEFKLLFIEYFLQTSAHSHDDITIQTCFVSDSLDLGRVDTKPVPLYLCTEAAKSPDMKACALVNCGMERAPDNVLGHYSPQN